MESVNHLLEVLTEKGVYHGWDGLKVLGILVEGELMAQLLHLRLLCYPGSIK